MKNTTRIIITLLITILVAVNFKTALAHVVVFDPNNFDLETHMGHMRAHGFPRMVINGRDSLEKVSYPQSSHLKIPTSFSQTKPLPHQELDFELSNSFLLVSEPSYENLNIVWDFGDGKTTLAGPTTKHTYSEPGSYIVNVDMIQQINNAAGSEVSNQFAKQSNYSSIQIDVLPNRTYKVPEASIFGLINPTIISKDLVQYFFDLSGSTGEKPLNLVLDYGDNSTTNYPVSVHTFYQQVDETYTVARVFDANGLFSDASLRIPSFGVKKFKLISSYKNYFFEKFEARLNEAYHAHFSNRLTLFKSVFVLGFLQFLLSPALSLSLFFYGFKKYDLPKKGLLGFAYSYLVIQIFFTMILVLLSLYLTNGMYVAGIFSRVLYVLSIILLVLLFFRVILSRVSKSVDQADINTLGAAYGAITKPFSFAVLIIGISVLDFYDALYLLFIFNIGVLHAYIVLLKLGSVIKKLSLR